MPIYEYQCDKCDEITEALQKFSDKPLRKCPACGGKLEKLMSMNSFQLKGSGWYVTDYAGKKEPSCKSGSCDAAAATAAECPAAGKCAAAKKPKSKSKAK